MIDTRVARRVSDSRLPLYATCPAAAVLPQIHTTNPAAQLGSAIHEHLEMRARWGREAAFESLPLVSQNWHVELEFLASRCRRFTWQPPDGALAETPLAWVLGGAAPITGGRGHYYDDAAAPSGLPPWWGPGTIDLMWAEPEPLILSASAPPRCPPRSTLWVVDYKSGNPDWVEPIEINPQLASGACKAAAWTGAQSVVPAVIFVDEGEGTWDAVAEPWGKADLDKAQERVFQVYEAVSEQAARGPGQLSPVEGLHCRWCPAQAACPALTRQLRAIIDSPQLDAALTETERQHLARLLPHLRALTARVDAALRVSVEQTNQPIDLGNGQVWGPTEHEEDELLSAVALPVLAAEFGHEIAMSMFSTSKAAIRDVAHDHVARGKLASTMRMLLESIGADGGIVRRSVVRWQQYSQQEGGKRGEDS